MKFIRLLFFINVLIFTAFKCSAQSTVDSLLNELNTALANKDVYVARKQQAIAKLNSVLKDAKSPKDKRLYGESCCQSHMDQKPETESDVDGIVGARVCFRIDAEIAIDIDGIALIDPIEVEDDKEQQGQHR